MMFFMPFMFRWVRWGPWWAIWGRREPWNGWLVISFLEDLSVYTSRLRLNLRILEAVPSKNSRRSLPSSSVLPTTNVAKLLKPINLYKALPLTLLLSKTKTSNPPNPATHPNPRSVSQYRLNPKITSIYTQIKILNIPHPTQINPKYLLIYLPTCFYCYYSWVTYG